MENKMNSISIDDVKRMLFDKFGSDIALLEYTQMNKKSKFRCNKHNKEWETNAGQLIRRGIGCPDCANDGRRRKHSFSFDFVKNFIEGENCILKSKEYFGCDSKLEVVYSCGHHGKTTFWNFKNGVRCPICSAKLVASKRRLGEDEIRKRLQEKGLAVLEFIGEYENNHSKVKTSCEKGHIEVHKICDVLYKCRCNQCSLDKVSFEKKGSGGSNWKGGKTGIISYLQKCLKDWKKQSLEISNNRCLICGEEKGLHVHHLYNFLNIMNEAFWELNIKRRLFVFEYSQEELDAVVSKVQEIHNRHLLGVALCKGHHEEFHSWYGKYNNTIDQFEDFIKYHNKVEK
jgi:hypothetical protein